MEEREESRIDLLTVLAVAIGLGAGLIAVFIRLLIGLLTNLAFYQRFSFSFSSPQYNNLGLLVIGLPAQFIVVVDNSGKPVGSVSRSDLIQAQKQKITDDTVVEEGWLRAFFRGKKVPKVIVPEG